VLTSRLIAKGFYQDYQAGALRLSMLLEMIRKIGSNISVKILAIKTVARVPLKESNQLDWYRMISAICFQGNTAERLPASFGLSAGLREVILP
jgi:hypothetical protein